MLAAGLRHIGTVIATLQLVGAELIAVRQKFG
jgi:hypothetical protein